MTKREKLLNEINYSLMEFRNMNLNYYGILWCDKCFLENKKHRITKEDESRILTRIDLLKTLKALNLLK